MTHNFAHLYTTIEFEKLYETLQTSTLLQKHIKLDKVFLQLELNKISDIDLRLGLLFELYTKTESYEVEKSKIINMIKLQSEDILKDIISGKTDMVKYQQYFLDQMKPFAKSYLTYLGKDKLLNGNSISDLNECLQFLESLKNIPNYENVTWSENEEISNKIKSLSKPALNTLKGLLVKQEHFEELVQIEKILN